MIKEVLSEKIPIKMWIEDIEAGAMQQVKNLANYPFAYNHIVVLPDCHEGFGMPIGTVMATEKVVVPNAVGVDIGCGLSAVKTSLTQININELKRTINNIRKTIPLGQNHNKQPQDSKLMPDYDISQLKIVNQEYKSALKQLGTLGGGNHFIEFQKGSDGYIWLMIHSGSRNIGYKVAAYYNKLAVSLNPKYDIKIPKSYQLAYLKLNTKEANNYLNEMNYCVDFALANRKLMMDKIQNILAKQYKSISFSNFINIAHNYAKEEKHFGKKLIVHRKGATSAYKGELGIIPGSQGTKSYIVQGKGNPESFKSCSHGAGRLMSRREAIKKLNLKEEIEYMNKKGIIHNIISKKHLDEAVSAYKNINMVINNQSSLINTLVELEPIAVIKA